ncbi:probable flap endonuclease 1 homolog isoform X4 [Neoarius graeffei]|uniref:probable flap endonuclease 1 homolog isoform X4 n=1 Tax=Neoarius graeffei TaxID=443677 RepID=UPI00298CB89D|nr:probable flap endonuclease 1 homolog isoform X4 [Neoarius graeffei]
MGIMKLADLIRGEAPEAISYKGIGDYSGKIIALDTSIMMNQFRSALPNLTLSLLGAFYRTLTFLEHGIKPVFVFDGVPPEQKKAVLEKRAQIAGWTTERPQTMSFKTQEYLRLLQLLGVPCVQAPGDAEAFCAQLVRGGVVDAVASEDMDTLAFGGAVLLRQFSAKKDSEVMEFSLPKLLQILQLTQTEFVDLCILLGCDYCEKITGLGPSRALKLIQQHRTIEDVILNINKKGGEGATEDGEVPAESHPQEEGGRGEKGTRQTDKSERILSCDTEETAYRCRRIHSQQATES